MPPVHSSVSGSGSGKIVKAARATEEPSSPADANRGQPRKAPKRLVTIARIGSIATGSSNAVPITVITVLVA